MDRLVAELAKPAVAGPVKVDHRAGRGHRRPPAIAKSLVLTADKAGKIEPAGGRQEAARRARRHSSATVEVQPRRTPPSPIGGRQAAGGGEHRWQQVDIAALSRDLLTVLPKAGGRQVKASPDDGAAEDHHRAAVRLGIKERVSTFTTKFTGGLASSRSQNIVQIAKEVDGAVVKPGKTFSLNGHTGPRGYAQGYKDAPVIVGGKLVPGSAAALRSSPRRCSTRPTTPAWRTSSTSRTRTGSAGIQRSSSQPSSTRRWTSSSATTPRTACSSTPRTRPARSRSRCGAQGLRQREDASGAPGATSPRRSTIYLTPGPSCIATNGLNGFTQDAWRIFRKGGKELQREKFSWRYDAEPRYVCG